MKKQFLILFAFISVLALSQVPQRFNKVVVTGDITSPKFIKTGSNADSVLLGNGSARAISTIKTDTVSLSNRINAKATGSGTASGTNTGDETLTSIKTKLGAATSVSDGYLKYQDWGIFNSKEPAFSKNTAFNKNFGTTPGTVLEGRTFGTAANSAAGDFIQNQNASAQSANMWISGDIKAGAATFASSVNAYGIQTNNAWFTSNMNSLSTDNFIYFRNDSQLCKLGVRNPYASFGLTFVDPSNNYYKIYHSGNLTSSLTTNYIPKWNGSSFVNSLISDDGSKLNISNNSPRLDFNTFSDYQKGGGVISDNDGVILYSKSTYPLLRLGRSVNSGTTINTSLSIDYVGNVNIPSTTPSTSPTSGALVVGGGIGSDHVRANNFYGNGSNLTGVQLPISLTTNGTSGAATFSGNVLNVPNYTSSGGVNQTQTTVNGSTSGNIVGSMPFQTGSYKKVIVTLHSLTGTATYTYPVAFSDTGSNIYAHGTSGASYAVYSDRVEFFGASSSFGCLIIEGY